MAPSYKVLLTFLAVLIAATQAEAAPGKRVALVIGNSSYEHTAPLVNPKNDSADVGATLSKLGFDVVIGTDLDRNGMDRIVRTFAERLAGAELGVFFYAGHGLQFDGQNYLVPIDAKLGGAAALDFEMIRLDLVQRTMERETRTNILFLDACRDNPLARNLARALGTRSTSIGRGLAAIESGEGTLISFSTQPGNVALDGIGRNSPFAEALVKHIGTPGDDLSSMLINVRNDVMAATSRRQVPWDHSALTARVYFGAPSAMRPSGQSYEQQVELSLWASVRDATDPALLQTYLDRFPNGTFAPAALVIMEKLTREAKVNAAAKAREAEPRKAEEATADAALLTLQGHRETVQAIALASSDTRVLSGSWDDTVKVWELPSGRLLRTLVGHASLVTTVAATPDGARMVSGSADKTIKIWDLAGGQLLRTLSQHTDLVLAVAVTPDGLRIVSGSDDRTVRVWELASGRLLRTLTGHRRAVRAVAVTPDGARIVSGSNDDTIRVWDLTSGTLLRTLEGHTSPVCAVAVARNASRLVSASHDKTIKVWELASGRLLHTLEGHTDLVCAISITSDGTRLVSGSSDKSIKIWDLASGTLLSSFVGHTGGVSAVAVTRDGGRIVTGSADKAVKIWNNAP